MDLDPEKAIEITPRFLSQELTKPLMTMTIILTFGSSFQYGYNLWVVNHPAAVIQDYYNITLRMKKKEHQVNGLSFLYTFTSVIYSLGGLTGSLMVCPMADTCGRKGTLVIANLLAFVSSIFMGFSTIVHTYEYAIFSRLLSGVCSGIFSCAVPLYLAEIAPRNLRGGIVAMAMIAIGVGVLFSQILGLHEFLGSKRKWAILLSLTGILAVFQLLLLPNFPESPRFLLIQRKNEEKARKVLRVLRDKEDVEEEIEELHQEDVAEMEEKELSVFSRLTYKGLRKQIISVILLMAGQQFSGVNAVYYYAETIYRTKWLNEYKARYISIVSSTFILLTLLFVMTVSWLSYVTYIFLLILLIGHDRSR
uniref:Solute carrier family 2, facilitated glucose transporter member 5 n=1 Tax=Naja naja TaxID=35670 RepID=A0A8C7E336_NAJNA